MDDKKFKIIDEDGNVTYVPAYFEADDFVVATGNDGEMRLYDAEENNLDEQPERTGRYVNEEEGYYEDDLPDNVELVDSEDEEEDDCIIADSLFSDDFYEEEDDDDGDSEDDDSDCY